MARRYRKVEVALWDDAKFRELSPAPPSAQTLWIYLLTGKRTMPIPGVVIGREAVLADDLRWPLESFQEAFAEVFARGMAEADWEAGLVVLPRALVRADGTPRETALPESPNVVRGWAKCWDQIPECELKTQLLERIGAFLVLRGEAFAEAFSEAFPEGRRQPSPNQEQETGNRNRRQEEQAPHGPDLPSGWGSISKNKQATLSKHLAAAEQLWALQEDLRRNLGARGQAPTAERLLRVAERLEAGARPDECEAVLRQYHKEAKRSGDRKWLNGETNWRPANFDRTLGQVGTASGTAPGDILDQANANWRPGGAA